MKSLRFLAGRQAADHIRRNGLNEEDIKVMAGAAGGPKWLALRHLDQAILTRWFQSRREPLYLIGSSIGAWRFACYAQQDPIQAFERFERAYLSYTWKADHSPAKVTADSFDILRKLMGRRGIKEIVEHPFMRLNVMTVRSKRPLDSEKPATLKAALTILAVANAMRRSNLGYFFERALFEDPRREAMFCQLEGLPIQRIALTMDNLELALLASSSIPTVLKGIRNIPGAPEGIYRDGGITDYHFDIPFLEGRNGIVFYPHFTHRIVPGWFDKYLPWRKANEENIERMLVVCPSQELLETLPHKKIPDRTDFVKMPSDDRLSYWGIVLKETERMAEDFERVLDTETIGERLEPLEP